MGPKKTATTSKSTASVGKTTNNTKASSSTTKASPAKQTTSSATKPKPGVKKSTQASTSKVTSKTKKPPSKPVNAEKPGPSHPEATEVEVVEKVEMVMCPFKQLSDVLIQDVDEKIKNSGKCVLLVDTSGLAVTFLRYRDTNYVNMLNTNETDPEMLRKAVLGAIWYGKQLVMDMMEMDFTELIKTRLNVIQANLYQDLITKDILKDRRYQSLVRPSDEEQYQEIDIYTEMRVEKFMMVISTKREEPPPEWTKGFYCIKVVQP